MAENNRKSKHSPSRMESSKRRCLHQNSQLALTRNPPHSNFFRGLRVYVFPVNIGSVRRKVLYNLVMKFGGAIDTTISETTTHVLIDDSIPSERLCRILHCAIFPAHLRVVMVGWVSCCIRANCCIDTDGFEIAVTHRPLFCHHAYCGSANCNDPNVPRPEEASDDSWAEASESDSDSSSNEASFPCCYASTYYGPDPNIFISEQVEAARIMNVDGECVVDRLWEAVHKQHQKELLEGDANGISDPRFAFAKVYGIQFSDANKYFKQGLRTLDDLKEKGNLTRVQKIGLTYYDDFQDKMPRKEATKILKIVQETAISISPYLICEALGSYRRKRETCGDVNLMITLPPGTPPSEMFPDLIVKLHNIGFLTDDIIRREQSGEQLKYIGVCRVDEEAMHRKVMIVIVPRVEYACALMHFTGTSYFNRSMQHIAMRKHMSLNEHCLTVAHTPEENCGCCEILHTPTEESIFTYLGVDFVEPEKREFIISY